MNLLLSNKVFSSPWKSIQKDDICKSVSVNIDSTPLDMLICGWKCHVYWKGCIGLFVLPFQHYRRNFEVIRIHMVVNTDIKCMSPRILPCRWLKGREREMPSKNQTCCCAEKFWPKYEICSTVSISPHGLFKFLVFFFLFFVCVLATAIAWTNPATTA